MASDFGAFRGAPVFDGGGFGTGGNTGMAKVTGKVKTSPVSTGSWHPTVIYLIALLVVEWIAFVCLVKFI